MSLFSKRKGRRISACEDDGAPGQGGTPLNDDSNSGDPVVHPPAVRFGKRSLKPSALRRSLNVGENEDDSADQSTAEGDGENHKDEDDDGPVVVRPIIGRSGPAKSKKKRLSTVPIASRLPFDNHGDDADNDDGDASMSNADVPVSSSVHSTPRRKLRGSGGSSLSQRVLETNAFRKSLSGRLPTRQLLRDPDEVDGTNGDIYRGDSEHEVDEDGDGRPRYSQAYLDELQSSTPNTPLRFTDSKRQARDSDGGGGDDENDDYGAEAMDLDVSELEGALIVDASELGSLRSSSIPPPLVAHVLTATEIAERKERRARRTRELEAVQMALGSDDEERGYIALLPEDQTQKHAAKEQTRLVREDEDLGEGFDEFVEDEPLMFGRKAQRAARRNRQDAMVALIDAAEGDSDDEQHGKQQTGDGGGGGDASSDSEAERRAAYDAAQTRAAMGLGGFARLAAARHRSNENDDTSGLDGSYTRLPSADALVVPTMAALPDLSACLERMQRTVQALADAAAAKRAQLAAVAREQAEIAAREAEVQGILNTTAQKYEGVLGGTGAAAAAASQMLKTAAAAGSGPGSAKQSPLRPLGLGLCGDPAAERGLESLGTTPRKGYADDVYDD